jgi:hypothetical protein
MGLTDYFKKTELKKVTRESNQKIGPEKFYALGNLAEQQYKLKLYGDAKKTLELTLDQGRKYKIGINDTDIKKYESLYENVLQKIGNKKEPMPKGGLEAKTRIIQEQQYSSENSKELKPYQEVITGAISVIGLVGGSMILFPTTTGNVIGNLNESTGNIFGIIFILLGLTGLFLLFKKKQKAVSKKEISSKRKRKISRKKKK